LPWNLSGNSSALAPAAPKSSSDTLVGANQIESDVHAKAQGSALTVGCTTAV
jgi:hypothetical protein